MTSLKLCTGKTLPIIGLGTFSIPNDHLVKSVVHAIVNVGYRHIDTGMFYKHEDLLGEALQ